MIARWKGLTNSDGGQHSRQGATDNTTSSHQQEPQRSSDVDGGCSNIDNGGKCKGVVAVALAAAASVVVVGAVVAAGMAATMTTVAAAARVAAMAAANAMAKAAVRVVAMAMLTATSMAALRWLLPLSEAGLSMVLVAA